MIHDGSRFPAVPTQADLFGKAELKISARDVDTSQAAADALQRSIGETLNVCLQAIRAAGPRGLTADEVSEITGIDRFTTRPRCSDLHDKYHLTRDSRMRRPNAKGNNMIVWVSIEFTDDDVKAFLAAQAADAENTLPGLMP